MPDGMIFGTLDWVMLHVFRNKIRWPDWFLNWAWNRQATPHDG